MPGKGHWDACVFVLFRHVGMWCGFMPNTGPLVLARWMTWGRFLQYLNLSFLRREIQGPTDLLNASQSWLLVNITWAAFEEGMWVLLHTNRIGITADRSLALVSTILLAQSCPNLCDPVDCSLSGSSVYESGLPFPSPGNLPNPGIEPRSPALQADALSSEPPGKPPAVPSSNQKRDREGKGEMERANWVLI